MHTRPLTRPKAGFALVATLSMMVLLVIVAVGMLSLSTIALRTSNLSSAEDRARANARMALMIAIGRLQEEMGPDQRISANAAILDEQPDTKEIDGVSNPQWLGAWNSWKAGEGESSQHRTIGTDDEMHPAYTENREDDFRSWLVSLPKDAQDLVTSASSLNLDASHMPSDTQNAVVLVGDGSLGPNADADKKVEAPLVRITESGGDGRYGWWIGDESQKARIMDDSYAPQEESSSESPLTVADIIHRSQAPASNGTRQVSGLAGLTDDTQLGFIASHQTLDLLSGLPDDGRPSKDHFHDITTSSLGVLADVREGGLKRDLNTLLERQIDINDDGDEFMLYKFNGDQERVPIQDISAFYQLYRNRTDFSNGGRGGVKYTSGTLNGRIQVGVPDYGTSADAYLREYTALYRNPVPVKVQFVLGIGASEITQAERDSANPPMRADDQYKLSLGVKPVISLWNPNNVPMVMSRAASQEMKVGFPPFVIRWKKYRAAGGEYTSRYVNLNYAITNESTNDGRARYLDPYIIKIRYAQDSPIVFEPGEVKTFTVDIDPVDWLENDGQSTFGDNPNYSAKEFTPDGFYVAAKTAVRDGSQDVPQLGGVSYSGFKLVFAAGDKITIAAYPESSEHISRKVARANEVVGGGLQFFMKNRDADDSHRNYQFISRFGPDDETIDFNAELTLQGFPEGQVIPFESETDATPGASGDGNIKSYTDSGAVRGLLMFTMMPGCELNNSSVAGYSAGRRIATRPFLHGSTLTAPQIADNSPSSLYDYGWEWQVEKINDTEEVLQDDGNSRGYYGGGYSFGTGTTHVVQQYLPVLPPISIASLSSTHLGGYSLANNPVVNGNIRAAPEVGDYRQTTATGQGGLAPHTLQAIGNSYAHPNLRANQAFATYVRQLNTRVSLEEQEITYVDHSYLANKALWDDFFFSSITPRFTSVELQSAGSDMTAFEVARNFLFGDNEEPLPNRRIIPYTGNLDRTQFDLLESQYSDFTNGFADKIASHLMVEGPFNINSTSEEAWKALFFSMRDKSVVHLEKDGSGETVIDAANEETPIGPGMLPNGQPIESDSITADPANPLDQWTSWRSLSDDEIRQLAAAVVKQVKKRGPFLSLSEFVNRRLDSSDTELAKKGAIQAALDDYPDVTINGAFINSDSRTLDSEVENIAFQFQAAAEGPIAYGSTPYVDQADLLRQFGSILTPRGDTYVIRAYGDALNTNGEVIARAWCEAVVQRTPNYLDRSSGDENHFSQAALNSEANKKFGRKFQLVSFRWLNKSEI